jgi:hypothetical protein
MVTFIVLLLSFLYTLMDIVSLMVDWKLQLVYNANKLSKFVRKRERIRNWLAFSQLKLSREATTPTTRVLLFFPPSISIILILSASCT